MNISDLPDIRIKHIREAVAVALPVGVFPGGLPSVIARRSTRLHFADYCVLDF